MARILFVINSLADGGAERVLLNVLSQTPSGWRTRLALLDTKADARPAPPSLKVSRLNAREKLFPSLRALRREVLEFSPDIVVSFLVRSNVVSALVCKHLGVPCVISERAHLSTHLASRHSGLRLMTARHLTRTAYARASHTIAVSDGVRHDLITGFGLAPARVSAIPNPYDIPFIKNEAARDPEVAVPPDYIVGVGRLTPSKGFGDLITAFSRLPASEHLCLIGEGSDRRRLAAHASALGVAERVHFLGYLENPFAVVARAKMFVSASYCEGFPNALAEAMVLGVPVVAADCASGPSELLDECLHGGCRIHREGKFGLLSPVGAPQELASAMTLLNDPERRARYGAAGALRMQSFSISEIASKYWTTFSEVAARTPNTGHSAGPPNVRGWPILHPE